MDINFIAQEMIALMQSYPLVAEKLNVAKPSESIKKGLTTFFSTLTKNNIAQPLNDVFKDHVITSHVIIGKESSDTATNRFLLFLKPIRAKRSERIPPQSEFEGIFETMSKLLDKLEENESKRTKFFARSPMNAITLCALVSYYAMGAGTVSRDQAFNPLTFYIINNKVNTTGKASDEEWRQWQYYVLWALDIIDSPTPSVEPNEYSDKDLVLNNATTRNKIEEVTAYIAIHGGNEEKMNTPGARLQTPLHRAVLNKNETLVTLLLNAPGTNINATTSDCHTALHYAVTLNQLNLVKLLIAKRPDMSITNMSGMTPLGLALQDKYIPIAQLLLDNGAPISRGDAAYVSLKSTAKVLSCTTLLHIAAQHGLVKAIKPLIKQGASLTDKDMKECTPLACAYYYGQFQAANIISDTNPAPTQKIKL